MPTSPKNKWSGRGIKIRWPKAGDDPFLVSGSSENRATLASLRWLSNFQTDDSLLAEGFKEAADIIVKKLERGRHPRHPDIYFFPIAYLYRHSFELQMKELIHLALKLKLTGKTKGLERALEDHRLAALWQHTRLVLLKRWPDGSDSALRGVDLIIQRFHDADQSGQAFRYTKDRAGKPHIEKLPDFISLVHLRKTCDAVFNFFSGCAGEFEHMQEVESEMREYYEP